MKVSLRIHKTSDAHLPDTLRASLETKLKDLFGTVGVDLSFTPGINFSTAASSKTNFLDLLESKQLSFPDIPGNPGHIIFARRGNPTDFDGAAGALVDTDHRGLAAIFTSASPLHLRGEGDFLQVCAHEIGHMMDLSHSSCGIDFPTAMCQSDDRGGVSFDEAWHLAGLARPGGVQAYPFAELDRATLGSASVSRLPWGGRFTAASSSTDPAAHDLQIEPYRDTAVVGEPFGFELTIRCKKKCSFPATISPEIGTLFLRVTRPDGTNYVHRPATYCCYSTKEVLRRNETRIHPFFLLRGRGSQLFPLKGRYRLEFGLDPAMKGITSMEIDAKPRRSGALAPPFSRFLATHAPRTDRPHWKYLNDLLKGSRYDRSPFLAYLAYTKAKNLKATAAAAELFQGVARSRSAPRGLRHAAWLELCWCYRAKEARLNELRLEAEDLFPDDVRDGALHAKIALWCEPKGENMENESASKKRTARPKRGEK